MESASKRWHHRYSHVPGLPAVVVAVVMVALFVLGPTSANAAAASRVAGGGGFGGLTSQGLAAYLETSSDGRKVSLASVTVALTCQDGGALFLPQLWNSVPITRQGKFRTSRSNSFSDEGTTIDFSETFSGRFDPQRTRLVATARSTATIHQADGSVDQCDSNNVSLRAHS